VKNFAKIPQEMNPALVGAWGAIGGRPFLESIVGASGASLESMSDNTRMHMAQRLSSETTTTTFWDQGKYIVIST
jgi:hypothetical protein